MRRSVVAPLALLLPLAACRLDFDPIRAAPTDAPPVDTPAPLPVLPCGTPPQFPVSVSTAAAASPGLAVTLSALAATATDAGYAVLAVDSAGDVHGFSFAFDGTQLVPRTMNAPVFTGATGPISVVDTPDGALAAIEVGRPDPTGTALVPLDAQLASRGAPQMNTRWLSLDAAIARGPGGTPAFVGVQSGGIVEVKQVSTLGTGQGAAHQVVDPSEGVTVATIAPAGAGYLVTWSAKPSPNQVRAEILDAQLAVRGSPTTIDPSPPFNSDNPRAGYAASADRYLFAWSFKTSSGDELWVSLRDNQLTELRAVRLSTRGVLPRVVGGKDDFLVAWQENSGSGSGIAAARVRFDGSIVPLVVSGNGGSALGWDLTTRAGQPALIWIENATAPGMWLDPLCN